MTLPSKIISTLVSITVVMASLLQFHHHDCDGNIYIHLTTLDDIALGYSGLHIYECNHSDDHHHTTDCNDHENCALHIAISKATKQSQQSVASPSFDLSYILADILELQKPQNETHISYNTHIFFLICPNSQLPSLLRAPPTIAQYK